MIAAEYAIVDSGLVLPAAQVLAAIPPHVELYHERLGRRHPLAVQNVGIAAVERKFTAVSARYRGLLSKQDQTAEEDVPQLLDEMDMLLRTLMEYAEACEHIVEAFVAPKTNAPILHEYKRSVKEYRTYIGTVVNQMKHAQGQLRAFTLRSGALVVRGYYVDGVSPGGIVGPNPRIHDRGNAAISFNRDLRYHFAWVLRQSTRVATAVRALTGAKSGAHAGSAGLAAVGRELAQLPLFVFPDETKKPWPAIALEETDAASARIRIGGRMESPRRLSGQLTGYCSWRGDGVNRVFKIPYVG